MVYEAELHLLQLTFKKCRVQTRVLDPDALLDPQADIGRSMILGHEWVYQRSFADSVPALCQNVIYKYEDSYGCTALYMLLPECEQVLLIGPYLRAPLERGQVLAYMEKNNVSPAVLAEMEQYYEILPCLEETSHLFSLLDAFAERLWGGQERFEMQDVFSTKETVPGLQDKKEAAEPQQILWNMQMMEMRYSYENEMMQAVSRGQVHKAERLLKKIPASMLEKRLSDPIRNMKNYCIIMNTLSRKSAEQSGVHPLYLDRVSSAFARKIEQVTTVAALEQLMLEMFRSYCRLVREHSMKNYSSTVRKTVLCIDSDLSADLSLSTLAQMQNVSSAYLSALFRKETGKTLTEYITEKRVAQAKHLLSTTDLQVQTIAQHCGILDVHYFSRVFKKYTGKTPKEFRADV